MAIFKKTQMTAEVQPAVRAAAGGGGTSIGSFYQYTVGPQVTRALSVPTVSRARDLIASMIGCLDLRSYTLQWTGEKYEKIYVPGESWFSRPDPRVTRNFIMANTFSDLFFYGRATWAITGRYSNGMPASFTWLPMGSTSFNDANGPQWFGPSNSVMFNGQPVKTEDTVQFLSPINGLLYQGARAVDIAIRLDDSARRFASNETGAGYLQQKGGEPMTGTELGELAQSWSAARNVNAIGALNEFVNFVPFDGTPDKMQLIESRQHAAVELSRVANIPAYLVNAPAGTGMTYLNAQQAREDLFLFGAKPFISCIEETLSMDTILPHGRHVEFDLEDYLGATTTNAPDTNSAKDIAEIVQKIYLGVVNGILTVDEARQIINEGGADLPETMNEPTQTVKDEAMT